MKDFGLALKRERDRERKRRATRQGAFEARMLSLDAIVTDEDSAEKLPALSDHGKGARAIRSFDEGLSQSGADVAYAEKAMRHYQRRYNTAYVRLKRSKPHLLRTFVLICQYGENRNASISILQEKTKDWHRAEVLYFFHRKKILDFFRIQ